MAIARRFGPEYGLSGEDIEANPLQVCQNLVDDRHRALRDLRDILYPEAFPAGLSVGCRLQ
jgi:hypothetical protein